MPVSQSIPEATARRLYNSVVGTAASGGVILPLSLQISPSALQFPPPTPYHLSPKSSGSLLTTISSIRNEESAPIEYCRICRWDRSDHALVNCPCRCRGSVGFVHLQCLRRWILHRRDMHCEICQSVFHLPEEKLSFTRRFRSFFHVDCFGAIAKQLLFTVSLFPLAHVVMQQVLMCLENINQSSNEDLTIKEVLLASCALITSSALFFNFFEFAAARMAIIRNILRQWWMFGNDIDFEIIELGHIDSEEFF